MNGHTWLQKSGATPGKLALVGCLATGLVFVLCNQKSGDDDRPAQKIASPRKPATQGTSPVKSASVTARKETKQQPGQQNQRWPKISIENAIANDPFAMPSWYQAAFATEPSNSQEPTTQANQLDQLSKERTKIVVISNGTRIATIGKENYRVGDTIEGFQITDIDLDGVVVEEID